MGGQLLLNYVLFIELPENLMTVRLRAKVGKSGVWYDLYYI